MAIRALPSTSLPTPRFSYTPCIQAGPWRQVSGMVALDLVTGALEQGGPGRETRRILLNLSAALPEWGLALSDLVIARIFTTRFDCFGEINAAWDEFIGALRVPPARTAVGVSALPLGASVEIEFCFWKDDDR